jgi:hypothetical protein
MLSTFSTHHCHQLYSHSIHLLYSCSILFILHSSSMYPLFILYSPSVYLLFIPLFIFYLFYSVSVSMGSHFQQTSSFQIPGLMTGLEGWIIGSRGLIIGLRGLFIGFKCLIVGEGWNHRIEGIPGSDSWLALAGAHLPFILSSCSIFHSSHSSFIYLLFIL